MAYAENVKRTKTLISLLCEQPKMNSNNVGKKSHPIHCLGEKIENCMEKNIIKKNWQHGDNQQLQ